MDEIIQRIVFNAKPEDWKSLLKYLVSGEYESRQQSLIVVNFTQQLRVALNKLSTSEKES